MISVEDYILMKKLVDNYEKNELVTFSVNVHKEYNPHFGDDRECQCGHSYYRHFDSYEGMEACGCKYCGCQCFKLSDSEIREDKLNSIL
jgi:hypothetical protein